VKVNEEGWNDTLEAFSLESLLRNIIGVTKMLSVGAEVNSKAKTYWLLLVDAPDEVYFETSPNTLTGLFKNIIPLQQVVSASVLVDNTSTRLLPVPRDVST
jgi:hypothetical protein